MSGNSAQWSVLYEEFRAFISLLFHVVSHGKDKEGVNLLPSMFRQEERTEKAGLKFRFITRRRRFLSKEAFKGRKRELWYTRTGDLSQWAGCSHWWEQADRT